MIRQQLIERIYVASSWKNTRQPEVVKSIRALGHEVYDFRHPAPGNDGFSWKSIDPKWEAWTPSEYLKALRSQEAETGFGLDMALATATVLILPCGKSAHLELGYAIGARQKTYILMEDSDTPELMYKMATGICTSLSELLYKFT